MLQKLFADALRVGSGLVDLVDGNNHRNACSLGVVDGFHRLGLQAIIGGDHEHHDIGNVGATRPHLREGLVARSVEESDLRLVGKLHLIGADMLRDSASFARDHVRAADRIEKRGLAVVDVAHDGHHRRACQQGIVCIHVSFGLDVDVRFADALDVVPELGDEQLGRVLIDRLVDRHDDAHLEKRLDEVRAAFGHAVREFLNGDRLRHDDVADLLGRRPGLHVRTLFLLAGALQRRQRASAGATLVVEGASDGKLA